MPKFALKIAVSAILFSLIADASHAGWLALPSSPTLTTATTDRGNLEQPSRSGPRPEPNRIASSPVPFRRLPPPAVKTVQQPDKPKTADSNKRQRTDRPDYDKFKTFLTLVLEPHARAMNLMNDIRPFLDSEQLERAEGLINTYDPRFSDLRRRRSEILEYERNHRMQELLLENQKNTILLVREIKIRMIREFLTPEQRVLYRQRHQQKSAANLSNQK